MARLGLERSVVDAAVHRRTVARQSFRDGLQALVPAWDAMIDGFNAQSGAAKALAS